ncbi:MAG TPA: YibE/F family protein, partial [Treponemataceae bacterium]|nr:YibE/F family protein [Treponemataceae bacterium]
MMQIKKTGKKEVLPLILCGVLLAILLLLPTGFEQAVQFKDAEKTRARILSVSNERIIDTGLIRTGQQICTVTILSGKLKGITADGFNTLNGSLESDKIFSKGDLVQCVIHYEIQDGEYKILSLSLIDHYRIHYEIILFLLFAILIIIFAGKTGLRSLLSFVLSILSIWKILIPL